MRKLNICCPICNKFKRIKIPLEIFDIDEGSLLKLPIKEGLICKHKFLVILDYHFNVRDFEVTCENEKYPKIKIYEKI